MAQPEYFGELMQAFFPGSRICDQIVERTGKMRKIYAEPFERISDDSILFEEGTRIFLAHKYEEYASYLLSDLKKQSGDHEKYMKIRVLHVPKKTLVKPVVDEALIVELLHGVSIKSDKGTSEALISKDVHRDPVALRKRLLFHTVCFKEVKDSSLLRANYHRGLTPGLLRKVSRIVRRYFIGTYYSDEDFLLELEFAMQLFFPFCKISSQQSEWFVDVFKGTRLFLHLHPSALDIDIDSFMKINKFIMAYDDQMEEEKSSLETRRRELREALLIHVQFNYCDSEVYVLERHVLRTDVQLLHASDSIVDPGMIVAFDQEQVYHTTVPIVVRVLKEGYIEVISIRFFDEPEMNLDHFIRIKPRNGTRSSRLDLSPQ